MELRRYWDILRRRWWLIVLLPLLAAAFALLTYKEPTITYGYTLEYSVSFLPIEREGVEEDPVLTAVQASEYITDDLTKVIVGSEFAGEVQAYLPDGLSAPAFFGSARAAKTHRILTIDFAADTLDGAQAIGTAVKQAVEEDTEAWLNDVWGIGNIRLELIHDSGAYPVGGGITSRLDVPLRVALALIAAIALTFALDYLDSSVRTRDEAERLAGPVLAEIPVES